MGIFGCEARLAGTAYGGPTFKSTHEVGRAEQAPDEAQLFFVGAAGQQWAAAHHLGKDATHAPDFEKHGEAGSTRAVAGH